MSSSPTANRGAPSTTISCSPTFPPSIVSTKGEGASPAINSSTSTETLVTMTRDLPVTCQADSTAVTRPRTTKSDSCTSSSNSGGRTEVALSPGVESATRVKISRKITRGRRPCCDTIEVVGIGGERLGLEVSVTMPPRYRAPIGAKTGLRNEFSIASFATAGDVKVRRGLNWTHRPVLIEEADVFSSRIRRIRSSVEIYRPSRSSG